MVNVQSWPGVRIIVKSLCFPGHRRPHKGQFRSLAFQGIEPQGHRPGPLQALQEIFVFIAQLGLDPLLTLGALYSGYRLWGFGGMLLAPVLAVAATQMLKGPAR